MNDLVERLRTRPTGDPHIHAMVHEAADEISRLRERIARLEEAARETISEVEWFVARKPDLRTESSSGRAWGEVLNGDLKYLRAALEDQS